MGPRAFCKIGKHSTNGPTSQFQALFSFKPPSIVDRTQVLNHISCLQFTMPSPRLNQCGRTPCINQNTWTILLSNSLYSDFPGVHFQSTAFPSIQNLAGIVFFLEYSVLPQPYFYLVFPSYISNLSEHADFLCEFTHIRAT